ncbi:hypothetical protein [Vibrio agarivorans]|uniref:Uncharacterized protein n=1 Tax=Vibrio agarivorans TaxID=153622 RepID=A0ABT7Y7F5_9VIBR|nr:hypothetical protein [Vibrio agarivorans]MDN2483987.1 hypothetical protein [Vibrio agarivorans]
MQRDLTLVEVNPTPRPETLKPLTDEQMEQLGYLGALAQRKKFAASLIVNLYNSNVVGADMYGLMGYVPGETSDTLLQSIMLLLQLSSHCESHEIYGVEFVEGLIEQWDFRNKRGDY